MPPKRKRTAAQKARQANAARAREALRNQDPASLRREAAMTPEVVPAAEKAERALREDNHVVAAGGAAGMVPSPEIAVTPGTSAESPEPSQTASVSSPWELHHAEDGENCVSENKSIHNVLVENLTEMVKSLNVSDHFWNLLVQRGVVDEDLKTRIQAKITKNMQALSLMDHIMTIKVYKFHGFIWALVNSNQGQLAELLGIDVRDYLDVDVYFTSSSFRCPACHEFYTNAYILTGCGHYVCAPCVKGAQFVCKDNKKEDITCPVPECGILSEASPSAGNIGLEEDKNFSDLCQAVLKEAAKPAGAPEGQSTSGREEKEGIAKSGNEEKEEKSKTGNDEEEGMSTDESDEEDGMSTDGSDEEEGTSANGSDEEEGTPANGRKEVSLSQGLQGGISDLKTKISCLQKYRVILEKNEPGVKDYITDKVEKSKQHIDEWAKETQGWYSNLSQQVEKNLQKSVKWQEATSELSVLMKARPGFLEGSLEGKINLPEETISDAGEKLITQLEAGSPIPPLLTRFPYISISAPPVKAKYIQTFGLGGVSKWGIGKVAWMPDGSLMVLTGEGVWRCDLNTDTGQCKPTLIQETRMGEDMSVAADGTWILSPGEAGIIEIHYPGLEEVKRWRPEGVDEPYQVFINNKNIFVGEFNSQIFRSYSRELVYVDQYTIGPIVFIDDHAQIHVTERGRLLRSSYGEDKYYTMDLETKKKSSFGRKGKGDGEFTAPWGMCTVSDEEYILVCDLDNNRVSVFTHDGHFIHHLDVNKVVKRPHNIAVLARPGKPTLMAVSEVLHRKDVVCIYRLE